MAIPANLSEVPNVLPYIQYVATSGQTIYPYPFPITQDSDLIVVINGVTLGTDSGYTLTDQGNDTGGNVILNAGSTAGDIITLYRDIAIERITQFSQNSGFSSAAFNAEFNNLYLIAQQLEASIGQCLQIPNTNNPAPITTLLKSVYAGKYMSFDSYGNPQPAALTSSGTITQSLLTGLLYPQTATEAAAGITPVNLRIPDHNAIGLFIVDRYGTNTTPGTTLMDSAIENAVAVASHNGGGIVQFLASSYKFQTPFTISTSGVVLRGEGINATTLTYAGAIHTYAITLGTVYGCGVQDLYFNGPGISSGIGAILLSVPSSFCAVDRCAVMNFGEAASTSYSAAISEQGANNRIADCRLEYCTYGLLAAGLYSTYTRNFISNHWSQAGAFPNWTTGSAYWGAIVLGGTGNEVSFNIFYDNGQGGLYGGGNDYTSLNHRIFGNYAIYNNQRGFDIGCTVTNSSVYTRGISIFGNVAYNNQDSNYWMAGDQACSLVGNTGLYDAAYATWFGAAAGSPQNIALFDGGDGYPLSGCVITGNTLRSNGYTAISLSYNTTPPANCTISGNATDTSSFIYNSSAYIANFIDIAHVETITVTANGWTGQTIGSQTSSIRAAGKSMDFSISLTLGTASTPSGNFVLVLPYVPSAAVQYSDFRVSTINGWNTTLASDLLAATLSNAPSGEVEVIRVHTGSSNFDAVAYTETGCTITILGSVKF